MPHTRPHRPAPPTTTPHPAPLHLTIPSTHDSLPLPATLHVPPHPTRNLAVLSHPYAPLGGSQHDPTLQHLTHTLLAASYTVLLFNFRGAHKTGGRTSWTGKPECGDYEGVLRWGVSFVSGLKLATTTEEEEKGVGVLCAGYSYGALVAARSRVPGGAGVEEARRWGEGWGVVETKRVSYSGRRSRSVEVPREEIGVQEPVREPVLETKHTDPVVRRVRYLLVSPPLGVVRGALMLGGGESVVDVKTAGRRGVEVCAVWGGEDVFTGVKRYRKWAGEMKRVLGERWCGVEVEGAGHFWGEKELGKMEGRVREWVERE